MNVGTAIDGASQCKKVQWKDESTKEQKFVSATCSFSDEELKINSTEPKEPMEM